MFDRYIVRRGTVRAEIHEHRAPTNESLQLLEEMRKEVRDSVLWKLVERGNDYKGTVVCSKEVGAAGLKTVLHVMFTLNGKDHHVVVDTEDDLRYDRLLALKVLRRCIAEAVTDALMEDVIQIAAQRG